MQRRIALALSLAITIITTFSIVTVGARTGLFGDGDSAAAIEQIAETAPPPVDVPVEQPAQPAPAYAAPADPVVVTEYVYV
ncbi:MAG: hypothetical protein HY873_00135, partial [Chloroflexi bacterium]|nr:hypothetical protein [Chloroflexota bacterium]